MKRQGYEYQSEFARKYVAEGRTEGEAKGRADEATRMVMKLLVRRCGMLGPELQAQVAVLGREELEALGESLLDFAGLADLEAWLAARTLAT